MPLWAILLLVIVLLCLCIVAVLALFMYMNRNKTVTTHTVNPNMSGVILYQTTTAPRNNPDEKNTTATAYPLSNFTLHMRCPPSGSYSGVCVECTHDFIGSTYYSNPKFPKYAGIRGPGDVRQGTFIPLVGVQVASETR